LADIKGYIYLQ